MIRFSLSRYALSVTLILCFVACEGRGPVQTKKDRGLPMMTKHHFREQTKEGFTVETWHSAGVLNTNDPVSFSVRITPTNKGVNELPKTKVHVKITSVDGKTT